MVFRTINLFFNFMHNKNTKKVMYISSEKNPLGSKYHFLYPYSSETSLKKTFRHPYESYESYLFT